MKKSGAKGACFQVQVDTVAALIKAIPYPVIVKKPDGTPILKNDLWTHETDDFSPDSGIEEIPIYWCKEEHLLSVWIDKSGQMSENDITKWKKSANELKNGLSSLVTGFRIPLPPPEKNDPLGDVKREFNAALETVERLISVSKLF